MAKRSISKRDKQRIRELVQNGLSYAEIVKSLGWDKIGLVDPEDAVRKQVAVLRKEPSIVPLRDKPVEIDSKTSIEHMSRESRNEHLRLRLRLSPRYKSTVDKTFSEEEKELFEYEYCEAIKSMDSLNEAEEQMLFSAQCEYVLLHRARSLKAEEERCIAETLAGRWSQGDPRFLRRVNEQLTSDERMHMERYESLMKALKLSRAQRLDKKDDGSRKTMKDLANELSRSDAKNVAADEIASLDRKTNEELKRLLDNGHLYGIFQINLDEPNK